MLILRPMLLSDIALFKKWLYTPYIAKWYKQPLDWIGEITHQNDTFSWIHHYIAEYNGEKIGFCQFYDCKFSDEIWNGYTNTDGTYSIDYMIGEINYLGQGQGKQIVFELIKLIKQKNNAKRIVVQPDKNNTISQKTLLSCGFNFDNNNQIFILNL